METSAPVSLSNFLASLRDGLQQVFPSSYCVSGEASGIKAYPKATYFELLELQNAKNVAKIKVSAAGLGQDPKEN